MRTRDESGFALLAVLWALVLVSSVATLYLSDTRYLARVSLNRAAELRARQGALSGQAHAANLLDHLHARTSDRGLLFDHSERLRLLRAWNQPDSTFARVRGCLGGACYSVQVRDLGALLNVNVAGETGLERLFRHLGVEEREAVTAAQSIADWIDHDDRPRPFGAESWHYVSMGVDRRPRNGPIADLSELGQVRGVRPAILALARPYLSVEGEKINVNAAPPPVLASLPGVDSVVIAAIVTRRRAEGPIADPLHLLQLVRGLARARLQEHFATVQARIAVEPQELEVLSLGWVDGLPVRVSVRMRYARGPSGLVPLLRSRPDR